MIASDHGRVIRSVRGEHLEPESLSGTNMGPVTDEQGTAPGARSLVTSRNVS